MNGPYHYVSRKLGFNLDKIFSETDPDEVFGIRKVLKLQLVASAGMTAILSSVQILSSPNFTTDSKNLYAKLGVAALDLVLKPGTYLTAGSFWVTGEISEINRQFEVAHPLENEE